MGVGGADQTARSYPGVDSLGESAVFGKTDGFTRETRQALSFPGLLNTASVHAEDTPRFGHVFDLLNIDVGVQPESQSLNESRDPSSRFDSEPFHDTLGFNDREYFPCFPVQLHSRIDAVLILDNPEPEAVMGQPVLGGIGEEIENVFPG